MNREFIPKDKIPTAEEFLSDHINRVVFPWIDNWVEDNNQEVQTILECMIEFTKLHVKAALGAAKDKAHFTIKNGTKEADFQLYQKNDFSIKINKNSIINSYTLTNIK
jgi:hypothetical protein